MPLSSQQLQAALPIRRFCAWPNPGLALTSQSGVLWLVRNSTCSPSNRVCSYLRILFHLIGTLFVLRFVKGHSTNNSVHITQIEGCLTTYSYIIFIQKNDSIGLIDNEIKHLSCVRYNFGENLDPSIDARNKKICRWGNPEFGWIILWNLNWIIQQHIKL